MKKKLLTMLLIVMVLVASLSLFTACNNDKPPVDEKPIVLYSIPEGLNVSVDVYNAGAKLVTITNELLAKVDQEIVAVDSDNYVAYSLKSLLTKAGATVPSEITGFDSLASDNYNAFISTTTIDNAFITIGKEIEENGVKSFDNDSKAPRFIADKTLSKSNINSKAAEIYFNPTLLFQVKGVNNDTYSFGLETTAKRVKASADYKEFTYAATTKKGQITSYYKGISIEKLFAMNPLSRNLTKDGATKIRFSDTSDASKVYSVTSNYADAAHLYIAFESAESATGEYSDIEIDSLPTFADSASTFEATVTKCKHVTLIELLTE